MKFVTAMAALSGLLSLTVVMASDPTDSIMDGGNYHYNQKLYEPYLIRSWE